MPNAEQKRDAAVSVQGATTFQHYVSIKQWSWIPMNQISLVLIEDQPVFIEGFRALCERVPSFRFAASGADKVALRSLVAEHEPDILFVDVANPSISPDVIRSVANETPAIKLVALTAARSITLAIQTLDAGAFGYVLKQSTAEELTLAIQPLGAARGS